MHTYHYTAEIRGISLGAPVALATISPMLRNTSMEQGGANEIKIHVTKTRTWPEQIALNEATLEVEDLVDRLALIDNHRVISVQYTGYQDDGGHFHEPRKTGGTNANAVAGLPDPVRYYELDRQKKILVGRLNPGLTRLHRTAQGMPDGIGKYLLLYGALQVMHGEAQAKVDEQLLKKRPDTLMVQGKYRSETILSHLRNMIAHPENDIDVQTLVRQAEAYCPMLSELVRDELVGQVRLERF
jgi:hypothetical protein